MLETDGFEIAPEVLSESQCAAVIAEIAAMPRTGAGSRRLLAQLWCRQLAADLKQHPSIKARLPYDGVAVQCTLFDKSPENNWLVALHQDLTIPVREKIDSPQCIAWSEKEGVVFVQPPPEVLANLLAVRVHLDPCGPDSGPLKVVPGSHMLGRLSAPQAESLRAKVGEVVCSAGRGSALLMRPLLLHASSKAEAIAPRRVLHFLFGPHELPHGLAWHDAV